MSAPPVLTAAAVEMVSLANVNMFSDVAALAHAAARTQSLWIVFVGVTYDGKLPEPAGYDIVHPSVAPDAQRRPLLWLGALLTVLVLTALVLVLWWLLMLRVVPEGARDFARLPMAVLVVLVACAHWRLLNLLYGGPVGTVAIWRLSSAARLSSPVLSRPSSTTYVASIVPLLRPSAAVALSPRVRIVYATSLWPDLRHERDDIAASCYSDDVATFIFPGLFAQAELLEPHKAPSSSTRRHVRMLSSQSGSVLRTFAVD